MTFKTKRSVAYEDWTDTQSHKHPEVEPISHTHGLKVDISIWLTKHDTMQWIITPGSSEEPIAQGETDTLHEAKLISEIVAEALNKELQ